MSKASDKKLDAEARWIDDVERGFLPSVCFVLQNCHDPEELLRRIVYELVSKDEHSERAAKAKAIFMEEAAIRARFMLEDGKFDYADQVQV